MSNNYFQIYYSKVHKLYDFTVFNSKTDKVIYHYHFKSMREINKIIQEYKNK